MGVVKLSRAESQALDQMIEVMENERAAKGTKVPLRALARPIPTTLARILRITASKPGLFAEDEKTLTKIEALSKQLKSKMSLADLLELRRAATER